MSIWNARGKIGAGEIVLTKKERSLLVRAGHSVVERRPGSAHAFDRLVELDFLSKSGKMTVEGARLRLLTRIDPV